MNSLFGFRIVESVYCEKTKWEFPKERFFEYEAKDEGWCRLLGIGRQIITPTCYRIGDTIVAHPKLVAEIRQFCKENAT